MRQVVLDTETTGLEVTQGHRIIEIGCIELIDRRLTERRFHTYLDPEREIEAGAEAVHGITDAQLKGKPKFAEVVEDFLAFVKGAELIIHNAPFDVGFLEHELRTAGRVPAAMAEYCEIVDSLALARRMHPGQKNSLDALCGRYSIDNSQRTLHGALLDAEILAEVYLAMTGGQADLSLGGSGEISGYAYANATAAAPTPVARDGIVLARVEPTAAETDAHRKLVEKLGESAVWRRL